MSIFLKNFGPYSKLRTANWPIAWRKQTQPYNGTYWFHSRVNLLGTLYIQLSACTKLAGRRVANFLGTIFLESMCRRQRDVHQANSKGGREVHNFVAELHPRAKRARGQSPIAKEMW